MAEENAKVPQETEQDNGVKLKGELALVGFETLEPSELEGVRKIVVNHVRKLGNIADFKEMKISLKQHKHGKTFKHEINALAIFSEGRFESAVTEWNLYSALSSVCEKI